MIVIGIDPGLSGAVAVVNGSEIAVHDMPTLQIKNGKTKKNILDVTTLAEMLRRYADGRAEAIVEQVHAMPGQGVSSMFNFGMSTGAVHGILAALRIPFTTVSPVRWKKIMLPDMGKDKDAAVARALQLFPEVSSLLVSGKKKYDGRAEALLMASYAIRTASIGLVLADEEE